MNRYGHREYIVYEHEREVNTIWYDGFSYWLAKDRQTDGAGFKNLANVLAVAGKMYDQPSFVSVFNKTERSFLQCS